MLMRHAFAGLPFRRTSTGSGLRQPGFMAFARRAPTRIKGLIPRIFMIALNVVLMAKPSVDLLRGRVK